MGSQWGRLLFASTAGLIEVTSNAGDCEVLLPIDPAREARFLWPQVLPLERGVLLTVSTVSDDADSASIVRHGRARTPLASDSASPIRRRP